MKNFKKVLALTLALVMVLSTMTTAFAATSNDAEAKVLYDLGLFDGYSADEYKPGLEDEADAQQALKLIGTALQWDVDMDATTTFEDVDAWAVPYVAYAVEAEITNGVSETEFGVDVISGKRVVTWFLRALGYDMDEAWDDTDTLAATAGLMVPATSTRDDVVGVIYDALMTTPVDGDATLIEAIILGDAALTAIAEEAGLVDATLSIVSVEATGVKTVEIKLNKAVDTDTTTIQVKKGAAIYSSSVEWNDAMNMATVTAVISLPDADYTAVVTTADEVITKDFTIAEEGAAMIEITSTTVDDETAAAEVAFVVNNQYGEDMEKGVSDVSVVAYNVTQKAAVPVANAASSDAHFEINTSVTDDFEEGDVIRFTVTYLGMTAQAEVVVAEAASAGTISLGEITLADEDDTTLDENDDDPMLGYVLVDQYGEVVTLAAAANIAAIETNDDVTFVISDTTIVDGIEVVLNDDDEGELFLSVVGDGTVTITAVVNATGSVSSTQVVVAATATVDAVEMVASTEVVAAGETVELEIVVTDQYGEVIENDDVTGVTFTVSGATSASINADGMLEVVDLVEGDVTVDAGDGTDVDAYGTIEFEALALAYASEIKSVDLNEYFEDGASHAVSVDDIVVYDQYAREFTEAAGDIEFVWENANLNDTATPLTIVAAAVGETELEIQVDTTNAEVAAGYITKTLDLEVIETADIDSYAMNEVGTIFGIAGNTAASAWAVEITVDGVYNNGEVYLAANPIDYVASSMPSYAGITSTTVFGLNEGTSTISVYIDDAVVASETITVSEDAPVATTVALADEDATTVVEEATLTVVLEIEDQYGVNLVGAAAVGGEDYSINPATAGYWASADTAIATVAANVVSGVADADTSNESVVIKYVTTNNITFTFDCTVTDND